MKKMSIFALLLAAVVATSYSVSGTYAKYTTTFQSSTDQARVAQWAFKVEEGTVETKTFEFNLFNTVTNVDGSAEENLDKTDGTIIAPGTAGSFTLDLANTSEVDATYTIDYTVEKGNIPLEFKVRNGEWTSTLADVTAPVKIARNNGEDHITIQWRWVYELTNNDETPENETEVRDNADTTLGVAGTDTVTVSAKVVATQAN